MLPARHLTDFHNGFPLLPPTDAEIVTRTARIGLFNSLFMRKTLGDFFVGASSGLAMVSITFSQVEAWIRLVGEIGTAVVMALTIVSLVRGLRKDK